MVALSVVWFAQSSTLWQFDMMPIIYHRFIMYSQRKQAEIMGNHSSLYLINSSLLRRRPMNPGHFDWLASFCRCDIQGSVGRKRLPSVHYCHRLDFLGVGLLGRLDL